MDNKKLTIDELVETEGWKNFMGKLEFYGAILLALSLLMLISGYTGHGPHMILTMTLSTLAIICYFMSFHKFESESKILTFLFYKIYGYGLAIGFITLLFIRQNWPYPKEIMTILSIILILISLYLGLREKTGENKNNVDWKYFLRIFVALIPLVYVMMTIYK